jgi:hypothetical protein
MNKACYKVLPRHKYILVKPYSYSTGFNELENKIKIDYLTLEKNGLLKFEKGFTWDGPSGPSRDTLNIMRGSLIHDGIYRLIRYGGLKYKPYKVLADRLLRKICRRDRTFWFRVLYIYIGVRLFGRRSAKPRPEVICVPKDK